MPSAPKWTPAQLAALGCTGDHRCCADDEHHTLDCPYYNVRRSNRRAAWRPRSASPRP